MRCPRCDEALHPQPAGRKAVLHACSGRHGVFATREDLRHILPVAAQVAVEDATHAMVPGVAPCPACAAAMGTLHPRGVELDACFACGGVWFDGGELDRVRAAPQGETSRSPHRPHGARGLAGGEAMMAAADPWAIAGIFQLLGSLLDW